MRNSIESVVNRIHTRDHAPPRYSGVLGLHSLRPPFTCFRVEFLLHRSREFDGRQFGILRSGFGGHEVGFVPLIGMLVRVESPVEKTSARTPPLDRATVTALGAS